MVKINFMLSIVDDVSSYIYKNVMFMDNLLFYTIYAHTSMLIYNFFTSSS
jgi:hypothetical protein